MAPPIVATPGMMRGASVALGDRVYELLADDIVLGHVRPGEFLREADVAERLGISRTPVREGLRRLGEVGLVQIETNRGYRAAPLDLERLEETAVVYCELSGAAARLAAPSLDEGDLTWLAAAERELSEQALRGPTPQDHRFVLSVSDLFLERCGNAVLVDTTRRLRLHVERAINLHGPAVPRAQRAERLGGIAAAARARHPELLGETVRVFGTQTLLDVVEAARAAAEA